jgi:hypothetical protein
MIKLTVEESFLFQCHALAECLFKLGQLEIKNDKLFSEESNKIYGQTARIVAESGASVFQGQGVIVSMFAMFLILPYEWKRQNIGEFEKIDFENAETTANKLAVVKNDTYPKKDVALRHIRNAFAHGRLGFSGQNLVVSDMDPQKGYQYSAEYSMEALGEIVQELNLAIATYIETVIKPMGN